jgi:hypothetical protein
MDTQAALFVASVVGWWAAPWYEPKVWGFGFFSGLVFLPLFIATLFIFYGDLPPFWLIYGVACVATVIIVLRGKTEWTSRAAVIAAGVNFAMIFLATYDRF